MKLSEKGGPPDKKCAIISGVCDRHTESDTTMKKFIHEHYHFIIAATALFAYTIMGGLMNNISSLYLVPVSDTLGVSRTSVSLTQSIRSLATFGANLMFGVIYHKFGFRKLCSFGLLLMGLSFAGLASSQTVISYAIFSVLIGIFDTFGNTASLSKLVNEWFITHRGLVLGLVTASSGIGGSLFSMILSRIIETNGWRQAHLVSGITLVITGVLVFLVIRTKPSDMGLAPYGEGKTEKHGDRTINVSIKSAGLPFDKLKKTPAFYLTLLSCALCACCAYAPFHILIAHLTDHGFTQTEAASLWSIMYLLMAATKILDGYLTDRVGAKIVVIVSTLCMGISCFLYAGTTTFAGAIVPTVLFAIGLPLTSIIPPLSVGEVLGMRSYDNTVGPTLSMCAIASLAMGPLMNLLYQKLGSYDIPMRALLGLSVFSVLFYLFVCRLAEKDKKKYAKETADNLSSFTTTE